MLFSFKKKQEQFIKKKTRLGRRRTSAVGRVPTNYNFLNFIMTTIKAIVNGVQVSVINGTVNIKLFTNALFDGFARQTDVNTGVISFERKMVNSVSFTMKQFLHFINEVAPLYSYYFAGVNAYELPQIVARDLFLGSTISFTREFQPAGTEYVLPDGSTSVTNGDRFATSIVSIEPNELNQAIIFDMPKTPQMVLAAVNVAKTVAAEVTEVVADEKSAENK